MKVAHRVLGFVAAGLFGISGAVQAQEIQFQGSTQGCLYASWESGCTPSASSSLLFLKFLNSSFDVTTSDWLAGIGSSAGSPNVNNLGSFSVTGDPASYNGSQFLLDVVFSLPTITSSPTVFAAAVRGSVRADANGLVKVQFDPGYQSFDFETPDQKGTFMLSVNDVSLTPGASPVALTGDIEVTSLTATPEPATTALLATGLAGLIPVVRMRRRKNEA
jgi:hypothetical protein